MADKKKDENPSLDALMKAADDALASLGDVSCWHPTGFVKLDNLIANGHPIPGGWPGGRIVHLYGGFSSGKSTLAVQSSVPMQRSGKIVLYLDFERSFTEEYGRTLGLDTTPVEQGGLFKLVQPRSQEEGFQWILGACQDPHWQKNIGSIIFDSVAAAKSEHGKVDVTQHNRIALEAGQWSGHLSTIVKALSRTEAVLFLINQTRIDPGVMFGNPETTGGGTAIKYYSSIMVGLARLNGQKHVIKTKVQNPFTGATEDIVVGYNVKFSIDKNKLAGEARFEPTIPVTNDAGFDNLWDCVDMGKQQGVIEVTSNNTVYTFKSPALEAPVTAKGKANFYDTLVKNPQVAEILVAAVDAKARELYGNIYRDRMEGRGLLAAVEASEDIEG